MRGAALAVLSFTSLLVFFQGCASTSTTAAPGGGGGGGGGVANEELVSWFGTSLSDGVCGLLSPGSTAVCSLFDGEGVNSTQITAITNNATWKKVVGNMGEAYALWFKQQFPSAAISCVYVGMGGASEYCYDLRSFGSQLKSGVSRTYAGTQGTVATCPSTAACSARRLEEGDPEDDVA